MQFPEWWPVPRAAWVRHSRISIRRWVGEGFSAHHREQPRGSVAQPDLSAGHQTGTGNTQGGLRQSLTSPSIVRAYYCRSAVSVQDCTVVKYISKCLPSELANNAFLGRATCRDP